MRYFLFFLLVMAAGVAGARTVSGIVVSDRDWVNLEEHDRSPFNYHYHNVNLKSKGTKYPSWSYSAVNPMERERYIRNNGNMVTLSVSYSADFGSIFCAVRRSLNNSDKVRRC